MRSTEFAQGFGAFSPRIKLTRYFGKRVTFTRTSGGSSSRSRSKTSRRRRRSCSTSRFSRTPAQFDLKPERDTQLEFGGHLPLGGGELGFRIWQKNANDLIDDTQVGVTLLHQDINYVLGRLSQEALNYVRQLPRNGRAYVSVAHTVSLNKGCETQLLAPCFGSLDGLHAGRSQSVVQRRGRNTPQRYARRLVFA